MSTTYIQNIMVYYNFKIYICWNRCVRIMHIIINVNDALLRYKEKFKVPREKANEIISDFHQDLLACYHG